LILLLSLAAIIGARILWQRRPGLPTCALFWGVSFLVLIVFEWALLASQFLIAGGILCNAAVTLANGGFMPVNVRRPMPSGARSLWVQRSSGQHLLFLADNFGNNVIRFSVGDVLLLAGIVIGVFGL
jgi:hypothetical protein